MGNTIRSEALSQVASCPFPSVIKSQNGKGVLSLSPPAVLEANQRLDSGSVWGLNKAPSGEGSVHGCPERRMGVWI